MGLPPPSFPQAPPGMVPTPVAGRPAVLLAVAQAVAAHTDPGALLRDLVAALRGHVRADYLGFALVDESTRAARLQLLEPVGDARPPDPAHVPTQLPAGESPTALVWETQRPLWLDAAAAARFPILAAAYREQGVAAACFVPLTTPRRRLGAMAFTSYRPVAPADGDVAFLVQIARLVALSVEGALTRQELTRERDRLALLVHVNEAVNSQLDLPGLLRAVAAALRPLVGQELTALWLPGPDDGHLHCPALELVGDDPRTTDDLCLPLDGGDPSAEAFRTGRTVRLGPAEMGRLTTPLARRLVGRGVGAYCGLPLRVGVPVVGVLSLLGHTPAAFPDDVVELLEEAARPVAVAVANVLAYQRIERLTARLTEEKQYLEEEIRTEGRFDEIVGASPVLAEALRQVGVVARTDTAVLVTGETGTGKELIARAVHRLSPRAGRTFVKLNCAAIPTGLLESELFGHEKGAFTGAVERRLGRFELADGGTLFLDEVGDIPLDLQPKLLRVLQEQEFERIGSGKTIKVDVRLVAATHRDLGKMVAAGTFRSDLFYRLHVFPVHLPPLRERPADVAPLAWHFTRLFARRMRKAIDVVAADTMARLRAYHWPGNIRELEHVVERAVVLSPGPELLLPPGDLLPAAGPAAAPDAPRAAAPSTLRDTERELIRRTLEECRWRIGGPHGAAARLGIKRTTLLARMKKLGFDRPADPPVSNG